MFKKILIVIAFCGLIFSLSNISFAEINKNNHNQGLNLFRDDAKPLVIDFIKKPSEKGIVNLLNKEFNKEIAYIEIFEGKEFISKNKNVSFSETELAKLKGITDYLTEELRNRADNSDAGEAYVGEIEIEFGL